MPLLLPKHTSITLAISRLHLHAKTTTLHPTLRTLSTNPQRQSNTPQDSTFHTLAARINKRLDDLGMSRNAKIVVVGVVGVLGTIESYFWMRVGWRWIFGSGTEDGEVEGHDGVVGK